jgi:oligoendopeptidase F
MSVDPFGRDPIQLFDGSQKDLIEKTTRVLRSVDPFFSESLLKMEKMEHLDLESRRGKAPGGFNYPLYKTGVPFVFMNAVGVLRDFVVLIHESGHAVHSIVTHDLPLVNFKRMPSEVAELASMAMELLTMEHWNDVLESEELVRAKKEQLSKIIDLLPWISLIDEFQHWIYTTPHTADEREKKWMDLSDEYSCHTVDWSGFEEYQHIKWQGQLHLYEVPFYYIEYAMAQLGAIGVWMNYKENPEHALRQYLSGLKLGYTKSIPEIYETAGVSFDFSSKHIQQLAHAVLEEYHKLN